MLKQWPSTRAGAIEEELELAKRPYEVERNSRLNRRPPVCVAFMKYPPDPCCCLDSWIEELADGTTPLPRLCSWRKGLF